ncbi:hypothetical protein Fcan01_11397 [Folsomia candida]|uniref:Endonuclease/exonuclease/phosphatase domain-containing protein n=1 Tax=Folsomia candida TaxID=158441 RepID=A0A226EE03_FOLCA|nr:hypothetical protein Fcan01_11397 [Folsomia candida]
MLSKDLEIFTQSHIICLYETWQESDYILHPFKKFSIFSSHAIKHNKKGRASGGISTLFRNDLFAFDCLVVSHQNFLIIRLKFGYKFFLVVNAYIQPSNEKDEIILDLENAIREASEKYKLDGLVVCGDFNARVGEEGQVSDAQIVPHENIQPGRISRDGKITKRGALLLEGMENNSLTLLNGRSTGDIPGNFTFNGIHGLSTIDLAFVDFCTLAYCKSLEVIEMPYSSHFPCRLTLNFQMQESNSHE